MSEHNDTTGKLFLPVPSTVDVDHCHDADEKSPAMRTENSRKSEADDSDRKFPAEPIADVFTNSNDGDGDGDGVLNIRSKVSLGTTKLKMDEEKNHSSIMGSASLSASALASQTHSDFMSVYPSTSIYTEVEEEGVTASASALESMVLMDGKEFKSNGEDEEDVDDDSMYLEDEGESQTMDSENIDEEIEDEFEEDEEYNEDDDMNSDEYDGSVDEEAITAVKPPAESEEGERYYALRRGISHNHCIFFDWAGLSKEIENFDKAEFEIFDTLEAAADYVKSDIQIEPRKNKKKKKASRKKSAADNLYNQRWENMFEMLKDYKALHGHVDVLYGDGPLGLWVSRQRTEFKNYSLGKRTSPKIAERIHRLESIGFNFEVAKKGFEKRLSEFKEYKAAHGTKEPEAKSSLMNWIITTRRQAKKFKQYGNSTDGMNHDKMRQLEDAGFPFIPTTTKFDQEYPFEEYIEKLKQYKDEHQSLDPPPNIPLGKWVGDLRKFYKRIENGSTHVFQLDASKIAQLNNLGFRWNGKGKGPHPNGITLPPKNDSKRERNWNRMFAELKEYKEEAGTCQYTNKDENPALYKWIMYMRRLKKQRENQEKNGNLRARNFLTDDKINKLNDIGFHWKLKQGTKINPEKAAVRWEENYKAMKAFRDEHGHCFPPHQPPYKTLVGWIRKQREQYRKIRAGEPSMLTISSIQRLNDIGFSWENKVKVKNTFEQRLAELTLYKEKHGTTVVPRPYPGGLGKWVSQTRTKYKLLLAGKPTNLTQEKVAKLNAIGMTWSVLRSPQHRIERKPWEYRFQELLKFKAEHGHTVVPQHYPVLGSWVHSQRVHYKLMKQGRKSDMSSDQAFKLADIGFAFEVMPRKKNRIKQDNTFLDSLNSTSFQMDSTDKLL